MEYTLHELFDSSVVMFSIFYFVFSVCLIFPPSEFVSAGLTIPTLFANLLGSEDMQFIQYHIRRTSVTRAVHSILPLGYFSCLMVLNKEFLWTFSVLPAFWRLAVISSVLLTVTVIGRSLYHTSLGFKNHPLAIRLQLFNQQHQWQHTASDINTEFRRIDKFSVTNSVMKIVATDNWVIRAGPYNVDIAHQSDTALNIEESREHDLTPTASMGTQILTIRVHSSRPGSADFVIRINALEYKDLKNKLQRPILNLRNIAIKQSLVDRFLVAFRVQVEQNPRLSTTEELEQCIGCMQTPANVQLVKQCEASGDLTVDCVTCYCRPMWCMDCMARWFASRQDQSQPEVWMSCKCPCPTCRSRFCLLDVCLVSHAGS